MSTYYAIREPGGRVVAEANSLEGAQFAKRILEAETGARLVIYGPAYQTYQRALEVLRCSS